MEEMSLEEAIELLDWLKFELKFIKGNNEKMTENIRLSEKAIETVLEELNNRIPISKIKHDLKVCEEVYEKEMKPYQREYGLDVTYLNKKEKAELINKRNCLIVQMKTYKQLLNKE